MKYDNLKSEWILNLAGLTAVSVMLLTAFYYQFFNNELPCPLCLLQRVGIIIIGFGFLFNLRFGIKGLHYCFSLLGCVLTGIIAFRQVLLHIVPGTLGYGSALFGLHFYTWALVSSVGMVIAISVMIAVGGRPLLLKNIKSLAFVKKYKQVVYIVFALLITGNLLSTILECGAGQCVDNPVRYELLHWK
jgi:disulfide bond formation protein DsbB